MYSVCNANNGFAVCCNGNFAREYVGRDGYWAREPRYTTPFKTNAEASAAADDLEGQRRRRWQ